MNHIRATRAEINLRAIRRNVRTLKKLNGEAYFCPMVKANAYGHGDVEVTRILLKEGVTAVGVALWEEGIHLRKTCGADFDILVFHPVTSLEVARLAKKFKLTPVVSSFRELKFIEKARTRDLKIHLKFDTGMSRLGFSTRDAARVSEVVRVMAGSVVLDGICTHLHSAENGLRRISPTFVQLREFMKVRSEFSHLELNVHALNSAGLIAKHIMGGKKGVGIEWNLGSRPGLSLYGIFPELELGPKYKSKTYKLREKLAPALAWKTTVVLQKQIGRGQTVSYGANWRAKRKTQLGVLPLGYADGFMRANSSRAQVLIGGRCVPTVGNVCMDLTMVDLTDIRSRSDLTLADVTIIGRQGSMCLRAEDLAKSSGTNAYEVLTNISHRVPRVFL